MRLIRDEIAGAAAGKIFGNKDSFWKLLGIKKIQDKSCLGLGFSFFKSVPKCIDTKSSKYRHP